MQGSEGGVAGWNDGRPDAAARRNRRRGQDHQMVQVRRRQGAAGRQPVRDRNRQDVDGGAVDLDRRAGRDPRAGGRRRAGRRDRGGDLGRQRAGEKRARAAGGGRARRRRKRHLPLPRGTRERRTPAPAAKPQAPLDPFRAVRTPERNYGPARLATGSVRQPAGAPARRRGRHRSRPHHALGPARPRPRP